ncbi:hypothetical protein CcaverHIS002_0301980 [Cutaneotrichosporon cavernicola]|uniref:Uncharacterized protein n=1 Tax=Cutaneotrichosporon cavernicola TaxID=279322 RepID=A0AA48IIV7_9TREE|nr:uncharacterized protein CcaverHIS019_0301930 [Cutaneotrichosporon cavernicola]BEI82330.1 hypothetical protein CcaverHIS002_0301980 [Cutaneotrichosporon cavernicola]BEI90123.1 hypothetical protein CcaverHIS019_0301930 [Cutaneotrichosporon cavernicola]BEI97901.1 hypothetical protein CcaverHIS631_0302000 [Cutaneotrichosporon cavernicola]BEJ05679.1 hypothetical protein CcaverHIS641_0302010 [Cutaneotrichosporon cavernicola]
MLSMVHLTPDKQRRFVAALDARILILFDMPWHELEPLFEFHGPLEQSQILLDLHDTMRAFGIATMYDVRCKCTECSTETRILGWREEVHKELG